MSSEFEIIEPEIQSIVNYISLFSAILTCVILLALGFFKYQLIDRVSLRIQGFIALIDVARHISHIKSSNQDESICQAIAYFIFLTDHLYLFLNVAIAMNIQFMLIQNKRPYRRQQWLYSLGSIILAIVINLIPLMAKKYGMNLKGRCRLIDDDSSLWWDILIVFSMNFPGTIYCLVVYFLVVIQLSGKKQQIRLIRGSENNLGPDPLRFVWSLYLRVSLYPLSCFITLFPYTLARLFQDTTKNIPIVLYFLFRFCRRITGTLNFITMLCDPHCQTALKYLWQTLFTSKSLRESPKDIELNSSQSNTDISTPCHHEIEYPNGDRIRLGEYIRLL